jgi:hypothetical protein
MPMYPKINTLWKRDESGKVIFGSYSCKEFELINEWEVTEKIDGMNIAVRYIPGDESTVKCGLSFFGRTENAQIPTELMNTLQEKFTPASMDIAFPTAESEIFCFGEGYGPKIQSGGNYISKQSFILFDVVIRDKDNPSIKWWLSRDAVSRIAEKLEVQTVPVIGKMTCRRFRNTLSPSLNRQLPNDQWRWRVWFAGQTRLFILGTETPSCSSSKLGIIGDVVKCKNCGAEAISKGNGVYCCSNCGVCFKG